MYAGTELNCKSCGNNFDGKSGWVSVNCENHLQRLSLSTLFFSSKIRESTGGFYNVIYKMWSLKQ